MQNLIKHSIISFIILYLLVPTTDARTQNIKIVRHTYNFGENINILYASISNKNLIILGIKSNNPITKIIRLGIYEINLTKDDFKVNKTVIRKFKNIKSLQNFLRDYKIKAVIFNDDIYGDYVTPNLQKNPVINYSKLEKTITFNKTNYTIIQQRIGNINKLHNLKTKITISTNDKIIFEKQYPLLIPFSLSEKNKIFYIHICAIKFGLLKSTLEYIFNKGLAMNCSSINLNTLKEEKLLTTYFDPNEFGNIMRGFPLLYVIPVENQKVDKIILILHKKKIVINLCKSGSYECDIYKKTSIPIEFPKMLLTDTNIEESQPRIILIYNNKIETITLLLSSLH